MKALYARVSSNKQASEGTIASQIQNLKDYCKEKNFVVDDKFIFVDDGVSGSNLERPGLEKLRDAAFRSEIDAVVILCPDRLARKYSHQLILIEEFKRFEIELIFVNREISSSPEDQLLFQVQGVIAEYEREKISERSRRGKIYKAKSGSVSVLSSAAFGYLFIPKSANSEAKLLIDIKEADTVRKIFEWYVGEDISIFEVTKRLNNQEIPTRKADKWSSSTVHNILTNTTYIGRGGYRKRSCSPSTRQYKQGKGKVVQSLSNHRKIRPESEWITIKTPQILSEKIFEGAKAKLESAKKFSKGNKKYEYLLSGLVSCKHCGHSLTGASGSNSKTRQIYRYYRCIGSLGWIYNPKRCPSRNIRAEVLDELVWDQIGNLLRDPDLVLRNYSGQISSEAKNYEDIDHLISKKNLEMRSFQKSKMKIIDLFEEDLITKEEVHLRLKKTAKNIDQIETELQFLTHQKSIQDKGMALIVKFEEYFGDTVRNLQNLGFDEKRKILKLLVEQVRINPSKHEIVISHIIPVNQKLAMHPSRVG